MIDWLTRDSGALVVSVGGEQLPLDIRRHPTAKRMVLRLADDGASVRVTLPRWGRTAEAVAFAENRADWLASQLAKRPQAAAIEPGSHLPFRGHSLLIDWDPQRPRKPVVTREAVYLGGPRETLQPRLKRWLQSQARNALETDLADYSQTVGLPAPPFALSSARRRWGSCSSSGTLRINWRLIMAPDPVRRSVVAHETAHRVHFDHSPDFYSLLTTIFEGDLKSADGWLRQHGRALYAPFG